MKKLIFLVILTLPLLTSAMTEAEEAIVLNQELQFLRDSVKNIELNTQEEVTVKDVTKSKPSRSLEEAYFDDLEEDDVSVRSSSRKRDSE